MPPRRSGVLPVRGIGAFECISGRRCVVEAAVASIAGRTPHLEIRRGAAAAGLVTGPSAHDGVPHVTGVRLGTGEEITADLVVDMTGRRSPLPRWLEAIGARPPRDELDDCGFIYYARHFRSAGGGIPPALGGFLMHLGTISSLTLPGDNGTWSVTLVTSAKDKALRRLRDAAIWEKAVRSLPLVAHWLDGQPIDDRVAAIAGIEDRHRALMVDGTPVATGVVAVGDAWACSNPTVGRGASIGMLHAALLRDTIAAAGLDDPWDFACSSTTPPPTVEPWYRDTLAAIVTAWRRSMRSSEVRRDRPPRSRLGDRPGPCQYRLQNSRLPARLRQRRHGIEPGSSRGGPPGLARQGHRLGRRLARRAGSGSEPGRAVVHRRRRVGSGLVRAETGEAGIEYDVTGVGRR